MAENIYLRSVRPGLNPGGVWLRICAGNRVLVERPLSEADPLAIYADVDGNTVLAKAGKNDVYTYFYDGDTGECMMTVIAPLKGKENAEH